MQSDCSTRWRLREHMSSASRWVAVSASTWRSSTPIELHGDELSRAGESALYHHYELNYTPPDTESGRRLARR
jgi:hypothetical protein